MRLLIISLFSMLAVGCASNMTMSDDARSKISSVQITTEVKMPEEATVIGGGAAFGLLGALADSSSDEKTKVKNYLIKNNIKLDNIIPNAFAKVAKKHTFLGNRLSNKGQYKIKFEVRLYGLAIKHGFSSEYKPYLAFFARMYDPQDKLVWEQYDYVTQLADTSAHTLEQFFGDPAVFQAGLSQSAQIISEGLLQNL